ncbi:MAG: hypothetical protein ACXWNK_09275 [Vulcanimicrobiaceae bacterium]
MNIPARVNRFGYPKYRGTQTVNLQGIKATFMHADTVGSGNQPYTVSAMTAFYRS